MREAKMPYQIEAKKIGDEFIARLLTYEQKEFLLLMSQWETVQDELESLIEKLVEKAAKDNLSDNQLFNLNLYKQFEKEAESKIQEFSAISKGVIGDGQRKFGKAGIEMAQEMIKLRVGFFSRLPVDSINRYIGKLFSSGAKIDETLFARSYPAYLDSVKSQLLRGVAMGRSPIEVARKIRAECNAPQYVCERLARTEQLNLYRDRTVAQFIESGCVDKKRRNELPDCCSECAGEDGQVYELGAEVETHPNCRFYWSSVILGD
jgi:hypothetical protein